MCSCNNLLQLSEGWMWNKWTKVGSAQCTVPWLEFQTKTGETRNSLTKSHWKGINHSVYRPACTLYTHCKNCRGCPGRDGTIIEQEFKMHSWPESHKKRIIHRTVLYRSIFPSNLYYVQSLLCKSLFVAQIWTANYNKWFLWSKTNSWQEFFYISKG